jgi:monoamine oxidase
LAASGLTTLVLEALPRLGGRAWTEVIDGMPLDLGCGWLHSADRNPWVDIAEAAGLPVDRRLAAWGNQYRNLGFPLAEREAARESFAEWSERVSTAPPASDIAAEALEPGNRWTPYLQALSGFISGVELEQISAKDYAAYDEASTDNNWRLPGGYGALVAGSFPAGTSLQLNTAVEAVALDGQRVTLKTSAGTVRARVVIFAVSSNAIAGDLIAWPAALDPWRAAAHDVPLGNNEKLFFEIVGDSPFEPETHIIGDPHDAATGSYYIRPFGMPVIECFLGGAGARAMAKDGAEASFERAIEQIASLFGASVRKSLKPLIASNWAGTPSIGGGYSHALPGRAASRAKLAQPYDNRLFFAGEATHAFDFSTAHGAYETGVRAAEEALAALA